MSNHSFLFVQIYYGLALQNIIQFIYWKKLSY